MSRAGRNWQRRKTSARSKTFSQPAPLRCSSPLDTAAGTGHSQWRGAAGGARCVQGFLQPCSAAPEPAGAHAGRTLCRVAACRSETDAGSAGHRSAGAGRAHVGVLDQAVELRTGQADSLNTHCPHRAGECLGSSSGNAQEIGSGNTSVTLEMGKNMKTI